MKIENGEAKFVAGIRDKLDQSVDRLDADLVFRLRRARLHALQHQRRSRAVLRRPVRWMVAAGVGLLLLTTIFFRFDVTSESPKARFVSTIEDVELLSASETPDFFSDMDFYAWLAEEMGNGV